MNAHVLEYPAPTPSDRVAVPAARDRLSTATLCLLAVLYPFHSSAFLDVNLSVGDPVVGALSLVLAYRFATDTVVLPRYILHSVTTFAVIAASIAINAFAPRVYFSFSDSVIEAVKFVAVAIWMIAIFHLLSRNFATRFVAFATVSVVVASLWSGWTVYDNLIVGVQRPSGPFENPNMYGNYLVFNAFLALGANSVLAEDATGRLYPWLRRHRLMLLTSIQGLLMLGLLSTGSRGALLAFGAGNVAAIRCWAPNRVTPKLVIGAILGAAVCAAGVYWFLQNHPYILTRVERTGAGDKNLIERLHLWAAARQAFYERPLFGIGYGQFRHYADYTYGLVPKVSHQTYLAVAAELGIAGLAACGWLMGAVLKDAWRVRLAGATKLSAALFGFIIAVCVQATLANVDQFRTVWITFGILAAMVMAAKRSLPPRSPSIPIPGRRPAPQTPVRARGLLLPHGTT